MPLAHAYEYERQMHIAIPCVCPKNCNFQQKADVYNQANVTMLCYLLTLAISKSSSVSSSAEQLPTDALTAVMLHSLQPQTHAIHLQYSISTFNSQMTSKAKDTRAVP